LKTLLLLVGAVAAGVGLWVFVWKPSPVEVPFAKADRQRLESTLVTNGKVEPSEWADVRAEREGLIQKVHVERGQRIAQGAPIVELDAREARADLAAAETRVAQAKAELQTARSGGTAAQRSEISSGLTRARRELELARKEVESLRRLEAKKAATSAEVREAERRVDTAELEIKALESRREALVTNEDRTLAEARLRDAEVAADTARRRVEASTIRAPMGGTVYGLDVREGGFVRLGDPIAQVGDLDRVRVRVYVDEPEMGRVSAGMPVVITWDARPGSSWKGAVESVPTQVSALGTRQVGEVLVTIDNPGHELLPGTNVNAEVQSSVVENAVTVPKEAIRKENNETGVFLLNGVKLEWRPVKTGVSSLTRTQVISGLNPGDAVALPTDRPLRAGDIVKPVFP
jgi:HlyD family secretion protein